MMKIFFVRRLFGILRIREFAFKKKALKMGENRQYVVIFN